MSTPTYTVRTRPWENGLELHIDGVGVTQSHGRGDAEEMARDYISTTLDITPGSFGLSVVREA